MKIYYLHCQKCPTILSTSEETERGLCNSCCGKAIEAISAKFGESRRSSLMDDFVAPIDLKGEK